MELYFTKRQEWRNWLEKHHSNEKEVWLVYYKKQSGKPRIPYNDAVEEALCFGWIDGKIKRINDDYFIQRFTPRRPGSRWSKYNIERIQKLIKDGQIRPEGLKAYEEVLDKPELIYENKSDGVPHVPDDLMKALTNNKLALKNFQKFPLSSRRMYIEWLNSAKKTDTRLRRIEKIVIFAVENKRPGMM